MSRVIDKKFGAMSDVKSAETKGVKSAETRGNVPSFVNVNAGKLSRYLLVFLAHHGLKRVAIGILRHVVSALEGGL